MAAVRLCEVRPGYDRDCTLEDLIRWLNVVAPTCFTSRRKFFLRNVRSEVRLRFHVLAKNPCTWHQIAFAAITQLLQLAFDPISRTPQGPARAFRNTMFATNDVSFASCVLSDSSIRGLAELMVTVIDQESRHVTDAALRPSHLKFESVVARIEKAFVLIESQAAVNRFAYKQCWMNHIAHAAEAHDVLVPNRFFAPVDLAALTIHENHIAKQAVPFGVFRKRLSHQRQGARPQAVV